MNLFRLAGPGCVQDEALVPAPLHRLPDPQEDDPPDGGQEQQEGRHQSSVLGRIFEMIMRISGFRIRIFFANPDPGKNLHADPDPDPGGIRGRGLGVKGKNDFF